MQILHINNKEYLIGFYFFDEKTNNLIIPVFVDSKAIPGKFRLFQRIRSSKMIFKFTY